MNQKRSSLDLSIYCSPGIRPLATVLQHMQDVPIRCIRFIDAVVAGSKVSKGRDEEKSEIKGQHGRQAMLVESEPFLLEELVCFVFIISFLQPEDLQDIIII